MDFQCKICKEQCDSDVALTKHVKIHSVTLAEYYTTFHPRYNLLTGDLLPYKNKKDYFSRDFTTRTQLKKWCKVNPDETVKSYILKLLRRRVEEKGWSRGPSHLELKLRMLPEIEEYQKHYGSYSAVCDLTNVSPLFSERLPDDFFEIDLPEDLDIVLDTREKLPLTFPASHVKKLDIGDYALPDEDTLTFVDRKSESDFKSTLTVKKNLDRFKKEINRAVDINGYLFVVTESSIQNIYKHNNQRWQHKSNLEYLWHNMIDLMHEFADRCQFVFTGNRENSENLIRRILFYQDKVWGVDLQHYIEAKKWK